MKEKQKTRIILFVGSIVGFLILIPLLWMFIGAFKIEKDILSMPIKWIPFLQFKPTIESFIVAVNRFPLGRYMFNSVVVTFVTTVGEVSCSTLAGFGFAKYRFPGRDILFFILLTTIMIPFQVYVIPLFIIVRDLGWIDTYWGLTIPMMVSAFGVFLMRQLAYSIPDELLDSARLDGANEFQIFISMALPLLKSGMISLAILSFIFNWNSFMWPLLIIQSNDMNVIATAVKLYQTSAGLKNTYGAWMAMSALATLPTLTFFIILHRHVTRGIALSGLKGRR